VSARFLVATVAPYAFGYYVSYLLRTVNAVIAPELVSELGLRPSDLGFLTSTYFLAFVCAQIPVGVALDRLGPRRVVGGLLLLGAVGTLAFSAGQSFAHLAVARGLAGLGVSACLMGGVRAFALAFPPARQASLTGIIMSAGALGALTASSPLERVLPILGWRGALGGVALACAAAGLAVLLCVPRGADPKPAKRGDADPGRTGGFSFLSRRGFWLLGPQAFFFTGGYMAIQGLWVIPFSLTVEGASPAGAARTLLTLNLGMLVGQLGVGLGATRLGSTGLGRKTLMTSGLAIALAVEATIVAGLWSGPLPWFLVGLATATNTQIFGVAADRFPAAVAGRVITALNLLVFAGAFALQWGLGLALAALEPHLAAPAAFRASFAVLWGLKAVAVALGAVGPPRGYGSTASDAEA